MTDRRQDVAMEVSRIQYDLMIELGIAVHKVGDAYDEDQNGNALSDQEKEMWCVSVLADSPLAATVSEIPLSATSDEAWLRAALYYAIELAACASTFRDIPG
jgi:hypothetical protein